MTIVSLKLKTSIYILIGSPGYGEDIVDCINTRDKGILGGKLIGHQEILPHLVKALACSVLPLIYQLLFF